MSDSTKSMFWCTIEPSNGVSSFSEGKEANKSAFESNPSESGSTTSLLLLFVLMGYIRTSNPWESSVRSKSEIARVSSIGFATFAEDFVSSKSAVPPSFV